MAELSKKPCALFPKCPGSVHPSTVKEDLDRLGRAWGHLILPTEASKSSATYFLTTFPAHCSLSKHWGWSFLPKDVGACILTIYSISLKSNSLHQFRIYFGRNLAGQFWVFSIIPVFSQSFQIILALPMPSFPGDDLRLMKVVILGGGI